MTLPPVVIFSDAELQLRLRQPVAACTCEPEWFPEMLDADCPLHGLRALIEGRFDITEPVRA